MMASATIDMRSGKLFVRSVHETSGGAELTQDDPIVIDPENFEKVGAAVRGALRLFQVGAPMPSEFGLDGPSTLYTMAGVSNWREFAKGAKHVSVRKEDSRITLIPYKNEWPRISFVPLKGRSKIVSITCSDADLGAAVVAAFAEAE